MTEFRKELNKLLKQRAIVEIVDHYDNSVITFDEAIAKIAERTSIEHAVFRAVKNDSFAMADMTDTQLWKKIRDRQTWELEDYIDWKYGKEVTE